MSYENPHSLFFGDDSDKNKYLSEYDQLMKNAKELRDAVVSLIEKSKAKKSAASLVFPPIEFEGVTPDDFEDFKDLVRHDDSLVWQLEMLRDEIPAVLTEWEENCPAEPQKDDYPDDASWQDTHDTWTTEIDNARKFAEQVYKFCEEVIADASIVFPTLEFEGYSLENINLTYALKLNKKVWLEA